MNKFIHELSDEELLSCCAIYDEFDSYINCKKLDKHVKTSMRKAVLTDRHLFKKNLLHEDDDELKAHFYYSEYNDELPDMEEYVGSWSSRLEWAKTCASDLGLLEEMEIYFDYDKYLNDLELDYFIVDGEDGKVYVWN